MAEPFKNLFNQALIDGMAGHFDKADPGFDVAGFTAMAADDLDALELKARSDQITGAMAEFLPESFEKAAAILSSSLAPEDDCDVTGVIDARGITGWATLPMTHWVGLHGLDHFDLSMKLLKELTKRGSSEFGIRFFLIDHPERTLSTLQTWTGDPSQHVRRLVSEGSRPRLPWAMRLPAFIEDPAPILPLLEALKHDKEEYVRRSVANNLNDIAKDHPETVARIAARWRKNASKDTERLVRHACRTLIKQGHKKTLLALGYRPPRVELEKLEVLTSRVLFGDALVFEVSLTSTCDHAQPLIIDYAVHHRKANGGTTPKVFKWKTTTLEPRVSLAITKKHTIREITTRVYYPGTHRLELFVNGVSLASREFDLVM